MDRYTIYLRTALFCVDGASAHVPKGVMVIEGQIIDRPQGALVVETASLLDSRGRQVSDAGLTLQLPLSKIDHIVHHG